MTLLMKKNHSEYSQNELDFFTFLYDDRRGKQKINFYLSNTLLSNEHNNQKKSLHLNGGFHEKLF